MVDNSLKLSGLEFLEDLKDKTFADLPRNLQRRILETEVIVFLIQLGTPPAVKFNIFKRINTGGMPLSAQEIRNAINGERVRDFIRKLTESYAFKNATSNSIGDKRMADRECVTRFLAFMLTEPSKYSGKDFDNYLNTAMSRMDNPAEISDTILYTLTRQFDDAMNRSRRIFGEYAFRKYYGPKRRLSPINKALYESMSCSLARLTTEQAALLEERKDQALAAYAELNNDADFSAAISQGTGDPIRVRRRFERMEKMFLNIITS